MGLVGCATARKFVEEGHKVILYDLRPHDPPDYVKEVGDKVKIVQGDISDPMRILEQIKKYDIAGIIHTARPTYESPYWFDYPNMYFKWTVEANKDMLELARIMDLQYLMVSSGAMYGPRRNDEAMKETDLAPSEWCEYSEVGWPDAETTYQIYIYSKVCMETTACAYHSMYGVDSYAMRIHEVYGPGDVSFRTFQKDLVTVLSGKTVELPKDDVGHDYTYNLDAANAFYLAFTVKPKPKYRLMNISGGRNYYQSDYINAIKKAVPGAQIKIVPPKPRKPELGRSHHTRGYLDTNLASKQLGYKPTSLEDSIKEYVGWIKKQPVEELKKQLGL